MGHGPGVYTMHIVPDSGTGGLRRVAGTMTIQIEQGTRHYALEYTLGE